MKQKWEDTKYFVTPASCLNSLAFEVRGAWRGLIITFRREEKSIWFMLLIWRRFVMDHMQHAVLMQSYYRGKFHPTIAPVDILFPVLLNALQIFDKDGDFW